MSRPATRPAEVRVAVCQVLCIDSDREGNFRRIEYALQQARDGRADIACLPESAVLGWENPEAHGLAGPIPGPDTDRLAAMARRYGLMICVGLDEKEGDRLYDSAVILDRAGRLRHRHRKINVLPELMDPPYATGRPEDIRAVETEFGRIGLMICADTFSEEHVRRMRDQRPDLVLVPYGWAAAGTEWPAHARKLERLVCHLAASWGCPVVGTDLVGQITHGPWRGRTYGGASVVAGADGKVVAILRDRDVDVQVVTLPMRAGPQADPR